MKDGDGISGKTLRWHVVRNCHPNASSSFDREEEEAALFNSDPWLEIPEDRRGTTQLKSFLGQLLCKRIREGFPQLQIAVRVKLQAEQVLLERLGEPRENHDQRSFYLRSIVSTYEDLARKALRSPAELPRDDIKLRGFTQNMNADFAKMMIKKGHKYKFLKIGQELEADWSQDDSDSDYDDSTLSVVSSFSDPRLILLTISANLELVSHPYPQWPSTDSRTVTNLGPVAAVYKAVSTAKNHEPSLPGDSKADQSQSRRRTAGDAEPSGPEIIMGDTNKQVDGSHPEAS